MNNTRFRVALALACLASLAACDNAQSRAESVVRRFLSDPDSAKFGAFEEVQSKNRDWACLEVNAKGAGGGYVGASAARLVKPAGTEEWEFQGIAGTQEDCVSMIHEMQPFEGGPR